MGRFCDNCADGKNLDGLWASHYYSEPIIRAMIHGLKYTGITELARPLADLLTITLKIHSLPPAWHQIPKADWLITSVPLTNKRKRHRGFNQAELIAKGVAATGGLNFLETLTRIHFKKPQVELSNTHRLSNVQGAFALKNNIEIKDKALILVDDVYTTGSTMNDCARVLKQAGVKEVWGLTVARG